VLHGRKQELAKQACTQKVGLLGIVNKASEIVGRGATDQKQQDRHVPGAPEVPPDLVATLVECPSSTAAVHFFPSDAALLQSWGKPGALFAVKADGEKIRGELKMGIRREAGRLVRV